MPDVGAEENNPLRNGKGKKQGQGGGGGGNSEEGVSRRARRTGAVHKHPSLQKAGLWKWDLQVAFR